MRVVSIVALAVVLIGSGDISGWGESTPGEVCGPFVVDGLCCSIGEFIYACAE